MRRGEDVVQLGADEKCDGGRLATEKDRGRKKGGGKYRRRERYKRERDL